MDGEACSAHIFIGNRREVEVASDRKLGCSTETWLIFSVQTVDAVTVLILYLIDCVGSALC